MSVTGFLKGLISPVTGIVDKAVNDKDLATQLKHELQSEILTHTEKYESELSRRHEMDMQSDSWLSKNIRPITLAFLLFVFVVITFFDGNIGGFSVNESYVPVYETLLMTVFMFYFGSRGIEKSMKMYSQKDNR